MASFKKDTTKLVVEIDTTGMLPQQVRLVKSINTLLASLIEADTEEEYFETSAELMRIVATTIKQSNFCSQIKSKGIPYADQALEYSLDCVVDFMEGKAMVFDN